MEENTTEGTFHGAKQDENAEFMNQKLSDGIYYEDETMQAIVLWTTSGGQMVLCLPKDGYSAEEALQSLTTEKLQKISGAEYRCVQLSLPKFKLESKTFSIKEALEAMGAVSYTHLPGKRAVRSSGDDGCGHECGSDRSRGTWLT